MSKNEDLLAIIAIVSLLCIVTSAQPVTTFLEAGGTVGRFYLAEFPSQLARVTEYRATALIPAASAVAAVAPPDALGTPYYAAAYYA